MTNGNAHRLTNREVCVPGFQKFAAITGEKTQTYIRGKRLIAMQDEDGAWSIFGNNYRGDVERVQRGSYSNGRYNNRYAYDAFGNYSEETDSPKKNPFRYCGEYTDDETGLIYLRNRYYDPAIGRFITEDPAKDGLNWYVYCGNNPIRYVDPTGCWQEDDDKYPAFIQRAIKKYTKEWEYANAMDNEANKITAHGKAESARALGNSFISRSEWGAQNFNDWDNDPNKTDIVIHHTDNNKNVKQIEKDHIKRGWSGIGYHFIISPEGLVYEGRPIKKKGAHVKQQNTGKIGVALIGDYQPGLFDDNAPSKAQLLSTIRLIQVLKDSYDIYTVNGHRDYMDTLCPGDNVYNIIDFLK